MARLTKIIIAGVVLIVAALVVCPILFSRAVANPSTFGGGTPQPQQPDNHMPAGQWNPTAVNISALAGTTTQVTVTLKASRAIPATRVLLSKRLRTFLTVSPTRVGPLKPGSSATLILSLTSSPSTISTTTSGFLALRNAQDPSNDDDSYCDRIVDDLNLARPLPITASVTWAPMAITGGVSLSVPPTLNASVDPNTGELSLTPQGIDGADGGGIGVSVDANPNQLSMADYYGSSPGAPGADLGASVGTTSIAGRVGYLFEPSNTMSCDVVAIVQESNGSFVNIDDYGCLFQSNGIFDAILRSIKLSN